ncbi:MAG: hypothetical protein ACXQS2_05415 [Methermicoccaceae archaeon]
MEGIAIPFANYEGLHVEAGDLMEMVDINSSGVLVEGGTQEIIVLNPSKALLDFLKEMDVKYRNLTKSEVDRYVREVLGLIKESEEEEETGRG